MGYGMMVHEAYRDVAERTAWGCTCEGAGTCGACQIRGLIWEHYGRAAVVLMEKRLWPSILKAKILEMGPDAGRLLLITSSETAPASLLKRLEAAIEPAAKAAGRDMSVPFIVLLERGEAEWVNDERMAALGYVRKSSLEGSEAELKEDIDQDVEEMIKGAKQNRERTGTGLICLPVEENNPLYPMLVALRDRLKLEDGADIEFEMDRSIGGQDQFAITWVLKSRRVEQEGG